MPTELGSGLGHGHARHLPPITNLTVTSVVLSPSPDPLKLGGGTKQLVVAAKNAQGQILPGKTFTYTSGTPAVATVSASGVVTPVALGTTNLTATCAGVTSNTVVCTVS